MNHKKTYQQQTKFRAIQGLRKFELVPFFLIFFLKKVHIEISHGWDISESQKYSNAMISHTTNRIISYIKNLSGVKVILEVSRRARKSGWIKISLVLGENFSTNFFFFRFFLIELLFHDHYKAVWVVFADKGQISERIRKNDKKKLRVIKVQGGTPTSERGYV